MIDPAEFHRQQEQIEQLQAQVAELTKYAAAILLQSGYSDDEVARILEVDA